MGSEHYKLIELSTLLKEPPRNGLYKGKEFQGCGQRWIKMSSIFGSDFFLTHETELLRVTESELRRFSCQPGDLLFGRTSLVLDGVGKCLLVGDVTDSPIFESNLFRLRFNPAKAYPLFYFYFFKSPYGRELIQKIAKQTAAASITASDLIAQPVPCPDFLTQKRIGDLLFSFEKKIDLNRQINATLEAMAQALFKSWFVDFDPVIDNALAAGNPIPPELAARAERRQQHHARANTSADAQTTPYQPLPAAIQQQFPDRFVFTEAMGWVPEGWGVNSISDLCTVKAGYAYKSADFTTEGWPVIKIKNITSSKTVDTDDIQYIPSIIAEKTKDFWLDDGDLLMAMTGATVGKFGLLTKDSESPYLLNQRVAKFIPNGKSSNKPWFIYCHLSRQEIFDLIVNTASGSAQPNISAGEIGSTPCIIPDAGLISFFTEGVNVSFAKILENRKVNNALIKLRDTLLPKLLSGQLRIPDAEAVVDKALAEA